MRRCCWLKPTENGRDDALAGFKRASGSCDLRWNPLGGRGLRRSANVNISASYLLGNVN